MLLLLRQSGQILTGRNDQGMLLVGWHYFGGNSSWRRRQRWEIIGLIRLMLVTMIGVQVGRVGVTTTVVAIFATTNVVMVMMVVASVTWMV
jgi:hypothetical protein